MSPKYSLNANDLKSISITLIIVIASAVVAKLLTIVPFLDLGKNSDLYTMVLIALLKSIQKYLDGIEQPKPSVQ